MAHLSRFPLRFDESQVKDQRQDEEISLLRERLSYLRKRRLQLHSEIQEAEFQRGLQPLWAELRHTSGQRTQPSFHQDSQSENESPTLSDKNLATRMYQLRKRRRIAGSHRIAGISLLPCPDPNALGVRLDVAVDGVYVAKHALFFDIAVKSLEEEEQKKLYLRLVQHTLPTGVPLASILERHFGGPTLPLDQGRLTDTVLGTLQALIGEILDECYALARSNTLDSNRHTKHCAKSP